MKLRMFIPILFVFSLCFFATSALLAQGYQMNNAVSPPAQIQQNQTATFIAAKPKPKLFTQAGERGGAVKQDDRDRRPNPLIQIAILLDTSNSMDGLIEQAKSQLWTMVNELGRAKDDGGKRPRLELALYEYGNDNISSRQGHIRQVLPLTNDLDQISEELFRLTTRGGSEYCGQVIGESLAALDWSPNSRDLKVIFIAGNEAFTQGSVSYREVCNTARNRKIIVNTVYCGDYETGVDLEWREGALITDGRYMNINQERAVVHYDAPQDAEIDRLNRRLNETYVGYGRTGAEKKSRQMRQDQNASSYGRANAVQRAITKSSANYSNSDWDIIDAVEEDEEMLETLSESEMPEEFKGKDKVTIKNIITEKSKEREAIQKEIQVLSKARSEYVAKQKAEAASKAGEAAGAGATLDDVMIKTIREQAESKSYCFDEE